MSLDINQIALHQLIKRDEQNLELVLRDSLLEPTETVVEMVAELHRVYSAKNKAYGLFSEESELAQTLRLQRQGEEDFLAFSRAATGRLRDELAKYPFADGGFVLFCHYRYLAVEYLLVAYSAAIFLIPICISFDTAEKRRYATYLILNRRFSFEF